MRNWIEDVRQSKEIFTNIETRQDSEGEFWIYPSRLCGRQNNLLLVGSHNQNLVFWWGKENRISQVKLDTTVLNRKLGRDYAFLSYSKEGETISQAAKRFEDYFKKNHPSFEICFNYNQLKNQIE